MTLNEFVENRKLSEEEHKILIQNLDILADVLADYVINHQLQHNNEHN